MKPSNKLVAMVGMSLAIMFATAYIPHFIQAGTTEIGSGDIVEVVDNPISPDSHGINSITITRSEIDNVTLYEDEDLLAENDITIVNGGALVLKNCQLNFTADTFQIDAGGALYLEETVFLFNGISSQLFNVSGNLTMIEQSFIDGSPLDDLTININAADVVSIVESYVEDVADVTITDTNNVYLSLSTFQRFESLTMENTNHFWMGDCVVTAPVQVSDSTNMTFHDSEFRNAEVTSVALNMTSCTDMLVSESNFIGMIPDAGHGIVTNDTQGLNISDSLFSSLSVANEFDLSTDGIVCRNTMLGNYIAIKTWSSLTIEENSIVGSTNAGIVLRGNDTLVFNNTITTASIAGIRIYGGNSNLKLNIISDCDIGLEVLTATGFVPNSIVANEFIDNVNQSIVNVAAAAVFYNGTMGNFWNDYNGTDAAWDGIGDIPYDVDSGVQDIRPLMGPLNDRDNDGLTNEEEETEGTNPLKPDTDEDGLTDGDEVHLYGTLPLEADSDDDGLDDYEEVMTYTTMPRCNDSDADGLLDGEEINDYGTDPLDRDSDNDLLFDGEEVNTYGTEPLIDDTDGDGLTDGAEILTFGTNATSVDTDGDTLNDYDELYIYGTNATSVDTDGDGLTDAAELNHADTPTDPTKADSDDDGLDDGEEINVHGTDPLNADTDGDQLFDGEEVNEHGTDPLIYDSDGDGFSDGAEVLYYGTDPLDNESVPVTTSSQGTDSDDTDDGGFLPIAPLFVIAAFISLAALTSSRRDR